MEPSSYIKRFFLFSSHKEEGGSSSPALLELGDNPNVELSRRAALVGGALLGATIIGTSTDVREAKAAEEPPITRKVQKAFHGSSSPALEISVDLLVALEGRWKFYSVKISTAAVGRNAASRATKYCRIDSVIRF